MLKSNTKDLSSSVISKQGALIRFLLYYDLKRIELRISSDFHLRRVDVFAVHDLVQLLVTDVEDIARDRLEPAARQLSVALLLARTLLLETLLQDELPSLLRRVDQRVR